MHGVMNILARAESFLDSLLVEQIPGNMFIASYGSPGPQTWKSLGNIIAYNYCPLFAHDDTGSLKRAFADCPSADAFVECCEQAAATIIRQGLFTFRFVEKSIMKLCHNKMGLNLSERKKYISGGSIGLPEDIIDSVKSDIQAGRVDGVANLKKVAHSQCMAFLFHLFSLRINEADDKADEAIKLIEALQSINSQDSETPPTIKGFCDVNGPELENFPNFQKALHSLVLQEIVQDDDGDDAMEKLAYNISCIGFFQTAVMLPMKYLNDTSQSERVLLFLLEKVTHPQPRSSSTRTCMDIMHIINRDLIFGSDSLAAAAGHLVLILVAIITLLLGGGIWVLCHCIIEYTGMAARIPVVSSLVSGIKRTNGWLLKKIKDMSDIDIQEFADKFSRRIKSYDSEFQSILEECLDVLIPEIRSGS
jgi:hypothetical protein